MICMFSDRDVKVVLKHVNELSEDVQIINIFPLGSKLAAIYKTKDESKKEAEDKMKTQKIKG